MSLGDATADPRAFPKNCPRRRRSRRASAGRPTAAAPCRRGRRSLALKNALRYVPPALHEAVAPEFLAELRERGRIYGYRFRPQPGEEGVGADGNIKARPVDEYRGILEARALQLNIDNNLDFAVALYPYELVTYGETGQVFQNWMQYRLVKQYLEQMTETQTLVVASGHPVGLFPTPSRRSPGDQHQRAHGGRVR